jgi:hypothetical protein
LPTVTRYGSRSIGVGELSPVGARCRAKRLRGCLEALLERLRLPRPGQSHDANVVWRHRPGPDDAALVVVLLDDAAITRAGPTPTTAEQRLLHTVFVEERRFSGPE